MKPIYLLKDCAGRGYFSCFASTAFDLPGNWTTTRKEALTFDTFAEASAQAQILPGKARAEIVAK